MVVDMPCPQYDTLPIEGLLGLSFLRYFRTLIDYPTGILEITVPAT